MPKMEKNLGPVTGRQFITLLERDGYLVNPDLATLVEGEYHADVKLAGDVARVVITWDAPVVEVDPDACQVCGQDCKDAFGGASAVCRAEWNAD